MQKLKVVLIDDETLIRKLLRMKVDWEALGMEVVAEFSSSKKALEEIEKWNPHIIITDICMPGMDGIEFSEACIALIPEIKIIILTGHDEFNYAMKSIKIGVADYILKPINGELISNTLGKIREKIESEKNYQMEYEKLAAQIEENLPIFKESYLNQILLETVPSEVFDEKMKFYGVELHPQSQEIQMVVVEIACDKKQAINSEDQQNKVALYIKARKLIEEFFSGDAYIVFCRDGFGRIVILSNNPEIPLWECLEILRKLLIKRLRCCIYMGISSKWMGYDQIVMAYKEALASLNDKDVIMEIKDEDKNDSLVQEVLVYIEQNLSNSQISMDQVAEQFYISVGYLGRLLKKKTGWTYGEYLAEVRFKKAEQLLITTDLKGYEIGEQIGIPDPHYLSIWFKKMSGCSLSEFRRCNKVQKVKV